MRLVFGFSKFRSIRLFLASLNFVYICSLFVNKVTTFNLVGAAYIQVCSIDQNLLYSNATIFSLQNYMTIRSNCLPKIRTTWHSHTRSISIYLRLFNCLAIFCMLGDSSTLKWTSKADLDGWKAPQVLCLLL